MDARTNKRRRGGDALSASSGSTKEDVDFYDTWVDFVVAYFLVFLALNYARMFDSNHSQTSEPTVIVCLCLSFRRSIGS
jgi:hypothetical protein